MFGSKVLEVGVGLSLLFLLVSLICTALREAVEAVMKSRAMDLERGLRTLLNDVDGTGYTKLLYDHPLIFSLFSGTYDPGRLRRSSVPVLDGNGKPRLGPGNKPQTEKRATFASFIPAFDGLKFVGRDLPSYIPSAQFARALLDLVGRGATAATASATLSTEPLSVAGLRAAVADITDPKLQRTLLSAIDSAQDDLDQVRANLEQWYNGTMDRVAGWYKRRTQVILFFLGLGAAVLLNVDTITVAQHLVREEALQGSVLDSAARMLAGHNSSEFATVSEDAAKQFSDELTGVGYPIGWKDYWPAPQAGALQCKQPGTCIWSFPFMPVASLLLGWLVTALAVTLGAPFWFDVLNKFMIVRSTVKPQEKSRQEGSKDA